MNITKFGHCCLLIETGGVRILTDPGVYSSGQNSLTGIDAILITHDHSDHLDVDSLKAVLGNNPKAVIYTNNEVAKKLDENNVVYKTLLDGEKTAIRGMVIEGIGALHEFMYPTIPQSTNTGYLIAEKLFYPGDSFTSPKRHIEILALPVAGPWLKLSEAIDYAAALKPRVCFPVHDGILKKVGSTNVIPSKVLAPLGIKFVVLDEGKVQEF